MFNSLGPPRYSVCDCNRRSWYLKDVVVLGNVLETEIPQKVGQDVAKGQGVMLGGFRSEVENCILGASAGEREDEALYHVLQVAYLLQNFALRYLWEAKVHHLVEKFVHHNKVIADGFLLHVLEVLLEDVEEFVKELQQHCCIGVFHGHPNDVQICVLYIGIRQLLALHSKYGTKSRILPSTTYPISSDLSLQNPFKANSEDTHIFYLCTGFLTSSTSITR